MRRPEPLLDVTDAVGHVSQRLVGVRQGEQVVGVVASEGTPAQVLGDPCRLEPADQSLELAQVTLVQRIAAAEVHRHAVEHDGRQRARLLEHSERPPAGNHEVLRDHLEPVDARRAVGDARVVRRAEPDAVAEMREERHAMVRDPEPLPGAPQSPTSSVRERRSRSCSCSRPRSP